MKLCLVHYHLRPGGVTSVIREQALALKALGHEVVVVSGEAPGEDWPSNITNRCFPGLSYRETPVDPGELDLLIEALRREAGSDGVLLFHNAHLGKSPVLPDLVARLAESGQALLLQAHDFAEDGRWHLLGRFPEQDNWYPHGNHIRWLVLNPRDAAALRGAGLGGVACIPNPVNAPADWADDARPQERFVLYPTRGLRRKNLGEFLLLAALAPDGWTLATTSRPDGGPQARLHARWQRWATAMALPVTLGMGWPQARPSWCLTTSMQEGFGLATAEPWAAGIPSTGRWLPQATGHWIGDGWSTPAAYLSLSVPVEWIDRLEITARVAQALGKEADAPETQSVMRCHFAGPRVDFGRLPEICQRQVMRRAKSGGAEEFLFHGRDGDAWTPRQWFGLLEAGPGDALAANRQFIASRFSPAVVGAVLASLADEVADSPPRLHGYGSPSMVLQAFSRPENFHFLRSLP